MPDLSRRFPLILAALIVVSLTAPAALPGNAPVRLTRDGLDKQRPCWANDGRQILFARHESDGSHIWQYLLDVRTAGQPARRLTDRKMPEYNGTFAPDGRSVLFVAITHSGTQGNLDIALINADGTGLKTIAGDPPGKLVHQDWPSWSPDTKRFAFSSTLTWTPDGRAITFVSNRDGGFDLYTQTLDEEF